VGVDVCFWFVLTVVVLSFDIWFVLTVVGLVYVSLRLIGIDSGGFGLCEFEFDLYWQWMIDRY